MFADNGVALACHTFESFAVNNYDPAPTISNDARVFELVGHQSNRRPLYSQHLREEFLGQRKDVGIDPIPGLEQPTGQPGFHGVEGVARRRLLNLREKRFAIACN